MDKAEKTRLNNLVRLDIANAGKTTLWMLIFLLLVNTTISIVQLIWYVWYDVQNNAESLNKPTGIAVSIVMMTLFVVHMLIMSGCFFACLNTYKLKMLEEESGMLQGIYKTFSIKIISIISILIYLTCFILSIVSLISPLLNPDTKQTDTGTIMVVLIVINSLILSYVSGIIFYYRLQVKKNIVKCKRAIEKTSKREEAGNEHTTKKVEKQATKKVDKKLNN